MTRIAAFALALGAVFAAPEARALSLSFQCITGNDAADCAIATSQLSVAIDPLGTSQARLVVSNAGPSAAVYTRILFDGAILTSIAAIGDAPTAVDFEPVSPGVLPGGNGNPYQFTADLEASATNPMPERGIGAGESLTLDLAIAPGFGFADVVSALTDGSLRIGMHVQSFASGGSESVLNVPVPEPGTLLLVGAGLAGLVASGARRR